MVKRDMAKMLVMMVAVFVVFSISRSIDNERKVSFFKQTQSLKIYDISLAQGKLMNDEQLSSHLVMDIDQPNAYFKDLKYTDDPIMWEGEYYTRIVDQAGQILHGRFSNYGYILQIASKDGHIQFKLVNEDNWLFY